MQSHPLWDTDIRGPGVGSGGWEVEACSWVVQGRSTCPVEYKHHWSNSRTHRPYVLMDEEVFYSVEGRVAKGKWYQSGCVERSGTNSVRWGAEREYSWVENNFLVWRWETVSLGNRSHRQSCCRVSVATVREHLVHRRRLRLSYISVG